jgi:hypothetical protein
MISNPAFSGICATNSGSRGLKQSAYRLIVASSAQLLVKDHGDLWDTGRVESASFLGVAYEGRPLQSHTEYFWKIKVGTRMEGSVAIARFCYSLH